MKKKIVFFVMMITLLLIMACSTSNGSSTTIEETKMAIGVQQTQNAFLQETLQAATAQIMVPTVQPTVFVDTAATQTQEAAVQPVTQVTQPPTEEPSVEPPVTEEVTAKVGEFDKIAKYVRADEAAYSTMESIRYTWADKNAIWHMLADEPVDNYVLSAKISWQAPENMGEPAHNGCGFVYGLSDPKHFHVTVISPDQKVHTFRKRNNQEIEMMGGDVPGGYLGKYSGSADMMLVVENKVMTTYIDGIQIVMFNDPYIDFGKVGVAIKSGSLTGFTCSFDEIEIWTLK